MHSHLSPARPAIRCAVSLISRSEAARGHQYHPSISTCFLLSLATVLILVLACAISTSLACTFHRPNAAGASRLDRPPGCKALGGGTE
eukprot:1411941-Prorocentrum_lima.AAC.1